MDTSVEAQRQRAREWAARQINRPSQPPPLPPRDPHESDDAYLRRIKGTDRYNPDGGYKKKSKKTRRSKKTKKSKKARKSKKSKRRR
jgi:hypothetical protein